MGSGRKPQGRAKDFDASGGEAAIQQTIGGLRWLAGMGIQMVYFGVTDVFQLKPLEVIAARIMPAVADL